LLLVMSRKPGSGAEAGWTADEGAAALVKAEKAVGGAGDANAGAFAEQQGAAGLRRRRARTNNGAQPERAGSTEVGTVERAVDVESRGEASRTAGEIEQAGGLAVMLHLLNAVQGFERADQNAAADSRDFGANVEHEVVAIAEIDVGVAAAQKHGAIARRWAAEVVRGGIALRIGFGFYDAAAEAAAKQFANDDFADEEPRQRDGVRG